MRRYLLLSVIILCVGCDSFRQSVEESYVNKEALKTFDALWCEMDSNYVYFCENGYDWDAYKDKYRHLVSEAKGDTSYRKVISMLVDEMQDVNIIISVQGELYNYIPENTEYNDAPWIGKMNKYVANGIYYWNDSVATDRNISFGNMYRAEDTLQSKPYLYLVPHYYGYNQNGNSDYLGAAFNYFNTATLQGVILDLRANNIKLPHDMMLEVLRYLLPEGENLIYYESRRNVAEDRCRLSSPEPYILTCNGAYSDKPLVVLFNPETTNEANIMCYILQERHGTVTISNSHTGGGGGTRKSVVLNEKINFLMYYPDVYLSNDKYDSFNRPLEPMIRIEGDNVHGMSRIDNRIVSALHCIDSINALK